MGHLLWPNLASRWNNLASARWAHFPSAEVDTGQEVKCTSALIGRRVDSLSTRAPITNGHVSFLLSAPPSLRLFLLQAQPSLLRGGMWAHLRLQLTQDNPEPWKTPGRQEDGKKQGGKQRLKREGKEVVQAKAYRGLRGGGTASSGGVQWWQGKVWVPVSI